MALSDVDAALTTTVLVKAYLGITDASEDTRIGNLVSQASAAVSTWCDRKFAQATYTHQFSGNGTPFLYVRNWPITSPMATGNGVWLHDGGVFDDSSKLTERDSTGNGHYVIHTLEEGQGMIERLALVRGTRSGRAIWPTGVRNIQVKYQGGYGTVPDPIAHAAVRLAAITFKRAQRGFDLVQSESMQAGGGSTSVVLHKLPDDVVEILTPWKRIRVPGSAGPGLGWQGLG